MHPLPTDPLTGKATAIRLFDIRSPQMRAFHVTWLAFCLCFFGWFGLAPFMTQIEAEFGLSSAQVGTLNIAAVATTIIGRLVLGWVCDRWGPRLAYTGLLCIGALPVMAAGLATGYGSLLVIRALIGCIGASFVITQYHTANMFAPNCVGTANATTAGWGNTGAGLANMAMPLLAALLIFAGVSEAGSWRVAMLIAGIATFLTGIAYFLLTQDTPQGNVIALRRQAATPTRVRVPVALVVADHRVWLLALAYACCFGVELTIHMQASRYFIQEFGLGTLAAGVAAGLFGVMAIFARSLGGFFGDRVGRRKGLHGRARWLVLALAGEAIALACFSQMRSLDLAIVALVIFALFVHMAAGATYSVTPFINRQGYGTVSGIVGAGGNLGAVAAGFLFVGRLETTTAFLILAAATGATALLCLGIRFRAVDEREARQEMVQAVLARHDHPAVAA